MLAVAADQDYHFGKVIGRLSPRSLMKCEGQTGKVNDEMGGTTPLTASQMSAVALISATTPEIDVLFISSRSHRQGQQGEGSFRNFHSAFSTVRALTPQASDLT